MTPTVRTRFAPSPTGYLHIGGVRTALFNWLFSRRHGGTFILRVDDTDRERNLDEALAPIVHGLRWLGLDWDEGPGVGGPHGPYFQSERKHLHDEAVATLLEREQAYVDYATPDELQAERDEAQTAGRRFVYSRRFMALTANDRARFEAAGRSGVVRLKMPREGLCRFDDLIRGEVSVEWAAEQDHVIRRADGTCLYHLASVVDDWHMRISHVIRAEEHLSNTPRQLFIARGLGYEPPAFAHLPFVAEPGSKVKLSKRKLDKYLRSPEFGKLAAHGTTIARAIGVPTATDAFNPVIVDFYERVGYLPEAILNYLLLLGWSLDDRTEIFSREEMVERFSLERVNRAPAAFDPAKLWSFQERYMHAVDLERKVGLVLPFLEQAGLLPSPPPAESRDRVAAIVAAAGDRIRVAGDILEYGEFFTADDRLEYDEKAFDKRLRQAPGAAELLAGLRDALATTESFAPGDVERAMQGFVERRGVGMGQIVHAVRVAVSGKAVGFGLFEAMAILGRASCLARIDRALERL